MSSVLRSAVNVQAGAPLGIRVLKNGTNQQTFTFPSNSSVCIGRHPSNDICLPDPYFKISRFHVALFSRPDGTYCLQDLGSRNGFRINGRRLEFATVGMGTEFSIGEYSLILTPLEVDEGVSEEKPALFPIPAEGYAKTDFMPLPLPDGEDLSPFENDAPALILLYKLSRIAGIALKLEDAFRLIVDEVARAFSADRVVIGEFRDGGTLLRVLACVPYEQMGSICVSRSMLDWVVRERRALLVRDTSSDERLMKKGRPSRSVEELHIQSALCIPLEWDGHINGILYLDSQKHKAKFSDRDRSLLAVAASNISTILAQGLQYEALRNENATLRASAASDVEFIGVSSVARRLRAEIQRVADNDATVLLTGETGVGKDTVAKVMHRCSGRRDNAFENIYLPTILQTAMETELFGVIAKYPGLHNEIELKGKFEIANHGTLFLNEIGEISPEIQAKLLQALEEKKISPLGRPRPLEVDIRIIAATNHDLEDDIRTGRFRRDLYERLKVFTIHVPPLRERRDDIPLLAGYFLNNMREHYGKRITRLSPDSVELLCSAEWQGNVRELKNAIERAVGLADSPVLTPELFPALSAIRVEPVSLREIEREHIIRVLEYTRGNKERAARILGVSKMTLYNKGSEFQLPGFDNGTNTSVQ